MKTTKRSAPRKTPPSIKKKPVERRKPIGAAKPDRSRQPDRPIAPAINQVSPDRSAKVQAALYEIASTASSVPDMQEFYAAMHRIVGELMYAKNFFIALYDEPSGLLSFPYFVDEKDEAPPIQPLANFRGATGWVLRHGKPIADADGSWAVAEARGEVEQVGTLGEAGIAVPLKIENKTIGVVFIQSYTPGIGYQVEDVKILEFVAQHIATALTRARAIEETRQRNAELAIINSVQAGLVSKLDMQAIYDLVGDKVREIFKADTTYIHSYDPDKRIVFAHYYVDEGQRGIPRQIPLGPGIYSRVIQTRQSVLVGTSEEGDQFGAMHIPSPNSTEDLNQSAVYMPIMQGEEVTGVVSIQSHQPHAYTENDMRLLSTLAASMSVALENVHLFDAEKQRAAELSIINSVQQGLASKLDMQSIYDLVGDKIQEIFDAQVVIINILDRAANQGTSFYAIERGVRLPNFTLPIRERIVRYLDETHQPLVINTNADQQSREYGIEIVPGTESAKALVFAPLIVGLEVKGAISLQNLDRENAFSDSDIRLLQTLANSMSVALENARLFDEVQTRNREITEALEQQTATSEILRVIASSPTDIQPVMEVIVEHAYRLCNGLFASVYRTDGKLIYEVAARNFTPEGLAASRAAYPRPLANDSSVSSRAILGRTTLNLPDVLNDPSLPELTRQYARANDFNSLLVVPLMRGDEAIGSIGVGRRDTGSFDEKHVALLQTFAQQAVIAIENVRLFNELSTRNREITEALEQQTATSEILSVTANSPTDVQPVLDVVAEHSARLCNSYDALIVQVEGDHYRSVAQWGPVPTPPFDVPLNRDTVTGRAIIDRSIVHVPDLLIEPESEFPLSRQFSQQISGQRTLLAVPMLREGRAIGAIVIRRQEVNPFTDKQISLLRTFADQAAIAIENVRLFNETKRLLNETEQRAAELSIINSVQQGLASKLDMQSIYDLVGDKIRDIFAAQAVIIASCDLSQEIGVMHYVIEKGQRFYLEPGPYSNVVKQMILARQPILLSRSAQFDDYGVQTLPGTERSKSGVYVPIVVGDVVKGFITLQNVDRENAFSESDVRLLSTLASSMSVALENARLFDETTRLLKETDQRAAELSIINSVQQGLASKLDMQLIYDLVGDKIREIFDAQVVMILEHDRAQNLSHFRYTIEKGVRLHVEPRPPLGFSAHILKTRQTLVINQDMEQRSLELGSPVIAGDDIKSYLGVPLIVGDEVKGVISLQNVDRENAFSDSDLRLLTTLASSMSVALENARLFDETQRLFKETDQRAAELSIINSVQQGLASKLDMQSIYDLVGDKIRDIFDAQVVMIVAYDQAANLIHFPFGIEKGQRLTAAPRPPAGFSGQIIRTRQPLMINQDLLSRIAEIDPANANTGALAGEMPMSWLGVPLISGDEVKGVISLQNIDRENAFSESDLRLLTTLSSSMSVALENARLFDETQRLLKETDQRAAELSIINSVQQGLASKLDMQSIYDLVGDKIREIFDAQVVMLLEHDRARDLSHFRYAIEKGVRQYIDPRPPVGFSAHILKTRQTLVINQDMDQRSLELGSPVIAGDDIKSYLGVPLIVGDEVKGVISLQNIDRENAFTESDVRLLTTLAASMSVALENARLFDETQRLLKETDQRAAELAIINSVQAGLASKLDMQSIYDLVGDKIREIFDAQVVLITTYAATEDLIHYRYLVENGQRLFPAPQTPSPFAARLIHSRESILVGTAQEFQELGAKVTPGTATVQSGIFVPLLAGGELRGGISLQNIDRENAFTESDVRLLETLAASMSVALENARLFDETQRLLKETDQRAAELAIINSVQQGLASKLDMQSIYDLVGDRIREIFDAQSVLISMFDHHQGTFEDRYCYEKGQRFYPEPGPFTGLMRHLIRTREMVVINQDALQRSADYGMRLTPGTEMAKAMLFVPLIAASEVRGFISLQNIDHENAFSDSDVRLLSTLASSMSVALENARLFDETQRLLKETDQRAAELALINSVQEGLASKLDVQSVYDLVGDKIRDIFDAQVVQIMAYDRDANRCHWRYMIEKGERQYVDPTEPRGFSSYLLKSAQPLMLNEKLSEWWEKNLGTPVIVLAGERIKSYLGVPLIIGNEVRGVISLQNVDREYAFVESDLRLLLTLASSMSVALENARLFDAERQRAQELEIINSVGEALASQLDVQAVYDLVGDKIRSIFDAQALIIATYDRETNLIHYPYMIERGQRLLQAPIPMGPGFGAHIMQTRQALMINQDMERRIAEVGSYVIGGGEMAKSYLGVPLIIGGEAKGFISLQNIDRENAFSESDLRLLTTLSSSMGVALENARLFAETNRRASEMSALTDIGREISSTLDLEAVIDRIALRAHEVLKVGTSAVYLLEPDRITLRPIAAVGDYSKEVLTSRSRMGEGIIGSVAQSGVAEMIEDAIKDPRTVHMAGTPQEEAGEKMMVAPLFARDQVIGAMTVWRDPGSSLFAADDLGFLIGLSRQAAIAIQNARLFEESQKRANETAALNEIGREISATLDINTVLERITQSARELLIGDTSAVYLVEPDGETLNAVVAIGDIAEQVKTSRPKLGTGIVGNIAQTGVPEFINNTALDRRAVHIAGTSNDDTGKKIMVAPLPAKDRILGVMAVWRDVDQPLFTQTDLDFLTGLARQAVIAIDNARLFDEVQQQKQYSESLVQYSPVAIVTSDLNNIVVSWNPGAEKLFGYKPAEAIGRSLDELITTEEQRVEAKKYSQQTMLGERIHAITRRLRKDGTFVDVELSSVPVKMGGSGPRSYVAIYHDITELQRAKQEAESANSAKSAFLATMSHEIRTPMNAIIGMSGLILDTPLNAEQREFAEIIRNSGDALLTIINDILDFSKIEAGKMEMESQPFDLRECLEGTLDLIATRAFDKGLDLAYVIDEHVPPTILGDITRVRQIVLNLLTNAVKFTEKGEVVLDVKPDGSIGPNQKSMTLHFSVRDTGIGIPPDRMSRLFQSFSQVDASTARKYGGTGLGLVISKRLSEMMGGAMWAISDGVPGKGATFHFTIKTQAADAPATSSRRDLRGVQPPIAEKRILIVDDNDTNRRILTVQTQKWGMQPRDTASPLQALNWIKRGDPFDVAILDMHMPEMDGIALAQAIRESHTAKALPLIMFTSLGRREGGSESIEFAAHLTKPIKPSQLFDALVGIFVEQPTHVRRTETAKTQFDPEMAHKHPLRILLAEDNAVNQKLALRLLQQMGYRADVAGNGLEAIEAVERQKYDVILMDVQMPELDGLDATRAIVARWPKGVRPQIIAMTANAMQGDREMCLEAGMDDYMTKPIRIDELVAALLRSKPTIDQPQLPLSDADKKESRGR